MIEVMMNNKSIDAEGHASQLICNTVSTLMWSLAMCMNKVNAEDLVVVEGDGKHMVSITPDGITATILDGFIECFKCLGEQFPDEVKIFVGNGLEIA